MLQSVSIKLLAESVYKEGLEKLKANTIFKQQQ